MSVLPNLLPYLVDMMETRKSGTINLVNPGTITHNTILEKWRDKIDPTFTWKNFSIEEQNAVLASERSNNWLDTTKLQAWYPDVKPIETAVDECIEEIKKRVM
jgi:3,5-epimerase/4-reductase